MKYIFFREIHSRTPILGSRRHPLVANWNLYYYRTWDICVEKRNLYYYRTWYICVEKQIYITIVLEISVSKNEIYITIVLEISVSKNEIYITIVLEILALENYTWPLPRTDSKGMGGYTPSTWKKLKLPWNLSQKFTL